MARLADHRELEEEREFLLRSIADLDRERAADDLEESDYRRLRDSYTARAAAVLRRIDAVERAEPTSGDGSSDESQEPDGPRSAEGEGTVGTPGAQQPPVASASVQVAPRLDKKRDGDRRPARGRWRRGLIVLAILCFVVAAGVLVVVRSGQRLPGQTASGSVTLGDDQRLAQQLQQARVLASNGDDVDAIKLYDKVLAVEPQQPEALAYRGWLVRLAGAADHDQTLLQQGRALVTEAVSVDPTYPDARAFLGYILFQDAQDPTGAAQQFRAFLADHPESQMVALTQGVVAQTFAAVGQPVPPASSPPS